MERVVYVLGAGFSAPLGIPVIRNFLITAKDLYFGDRAEYKHFGSVLEAITEMHRCKSYYNVDLFNIEEILSILEMEDQISGGDRSSDFDAFIASVIRARTPKMPPPSIPGRVDGYSPYHLGFPIDFFGKKFDATTSYGLFVANLLGLRLVASGYTAGNETRVKFKPSNVPNQTVQYSVVTLNYDLVLENCISYIARYLSGLDEEVTPLPLSFEIAKLHGSVDSQIVAPTWRKWVRGELQTQWELAHRLLSQANHIRFLGYSLPTSDSYFRYLLASAILKSDNLKSVDVVCLDDPEGAVRQRYEDFVTFQFFRYRSIDIKAYLTEPKDQTLGHSLVTATINEGRERGHSFADYDGLERRHLHMMTTTAT